MTAFFRKPLPGMTPLGERLRTLREERQLTLEDVSRQTRIQLKHLAAIEGGAYRALPGEVYTRNFLRTYASLLDVNEERVFALYEQERTIIAKPEQKGPPQAVRDARAIPWAKVVKRFLLFLAVPVLGLYLFSTVRSILTPPTLAVTSPAAESETTNTNVVVTGTVSPEAVVRVNGQEVFHDTNGAFSERVELQPGLNVITIAAKKERSKETVVERRILVQGSPSAVQ